MSLVRTCSKRTGCPSRSTGRIVRPDGIREQNHAGCPRRPASPATAAYPDHQVPRGEQPQDAAATPVPVTWSASTCDAAAISAALTPACSAPASVPRRARTSAVPAPAVEVQRHPYRIRRVRRIPPMATRGSPPVPVRSSSIDQRRRAGAVAELPVGRPGPTSDTPAAEPLRSGSHLPGVVAAFCWVPCAGRRCHRGPHTWSGSSVRVSVS